MLKDIHEPAERDVLRTPNTLTDLVERLLAVGVAMTTRALAAATPDLELTFQQWRTIALVGERPDGMTVSDVARRVGVTLPATSRQLHRLAARGLLELGPDPTDRRATRVRLTDRGALARDAVLGHRRARVEALTGRSRARASTVRELAIVAAALDADR